MFLKISQYSQENICVEDFFFNDVVGLGLQHLLKRNSSTSAFCEIFKNTYFEETLRMAASGRLKLLMEIRVPWVSSNRSSRPKVLCKRCSYKFHKIHRTPVPKHVACNFIKKETMTQVFSCEICEISKSTFSYRTSPMATSAVSRQNNLPFDSQ